LRPPKSKILSNFPFNNWLSAAISHRVRLVNWPVTIGLPPGMGFKSQESKGQVWLTLRKAIEQGFLLFEQWSEGELFTLWTFMSGLIHLHRGVYV